MEDSPDTLHTAADTVALSAPADENCGWYLYGITRGERRTNGDIVASEPVRPEPEDDEPAGATEAISSDGLLAIVRRVPLADFSPEALRAQAESPAWIESAARRHNAVIEAVHRRRTVLPAKFGCVYPRAEDVQRALQEEHDALLARLDRIDGCDEWGVRLYGDMAAIWLPPDAEPENVRRLRGDLAAASPGRAYFLQRKLADELATAADHLLDDLIGQAYEHFARHARTGQVSRQVAGSRINQEEGSTEVLRAAFLVPHESADAFIEDVRRFSENQPGLWCEYSGPWPPYSFAAQIEEEWHE